MNTEDNSQLAGKSVATSDEEFKSEETVRNPSKAKKKKKRGIVERIKRFGSKDNLDITSSDDEKKGRSDSDILVATLDGNESARKYKIWRKTDWLKSPHHSRGGNSSDDEEFIDDVINFINSYRKHHKAPKLMRNQNLMKLAREWVLKASKKEDNLPFQKHYGQILYSVKKHPHKKLKGKEVVEGWYNEIHDFVFISDDSDTQKNTDNFTQLVWRASKEIGVAKCVSDDGADVLVTAFFHPKGNVRGDYSKQVLPKSSLSDLSSDTDSAESTSEHKEEKSKEFDSPTKSKHRGFFSQVKNLFSKPKSPEDLSKKNRKEGKFKGLFKIGSKENLDRSDDEKKRKETRKRIGLANKDLNRNSSSSDDDTLPREYIVTKDPQQEVTTSPYKGYNLPEGYVPRIQYPLKPQPKDQDSSELIEKTRSKESENISKLHEDTSLKEVKVKPIPPTRKIKNTDPIQKGEAIAADEKDIETKKFMKVSDIERDKSRSDMMHELKVRLSRDMSLDKTSSSSEEEKEELPKISQIDEKKVIIPDESVAKKKPTFIDKVLDVLQVKPLKQSSDNEKTEAIHSLESGIPPSIEKIAYIEIPKPEFEDKKISDSSTSSSSDEGEVSNVLKVELVEEIKETHFEMKKDLSKSSLASNNSNNIIDVKEIIDVAEEFENLSSTTPIKRNISGDRVSVSSDEPTEIHTIRETLVSYRNENGASSVEEISNEKIMLMEITRSEEDSKEFHCSIVPSMAEDEVDERHSTAQLPVIILPSSRSSSEEEANVILESNISFQKKVKKTEEKIDQERKFLKRVSSHSTDEVQKTNREEIYEQKSSKSDENSDQNIPESLQVFDKSSSMSSFISSDEAKTEATQMIGVNIRRKIMEDESSDSSDAIEEKVLITAYSDSPRRDTVFYLGTNLISDSPDSSVPPVNVLHQFFEEILARINRYRKKHAVPTISMDYYLCSKARKRAEYLIKNNNFHLPQSNETKGEILYYTKLSNDKVYAKTIVDEWYNTKCWFRSSEDEDHFRKCAPFCQMIWKDSREMGLAVRKTIDQLSFLLVAIFVPAGNVPSQYKEQVYLLVREVTSSSSDQSSSDEEEPISKIEKKRANLRESYLEQKTEDQNIFHERTSSSSSDLSKEGRKSRVEKMVEKIEANYEENTPPETEFRDKTEDESVIEATEADVTRGDKRKSIVESIVEEIERRKLEEIALKTVKSNSSFSSNEMKHDDERSSSSDSKTSLSERETSESDTRIISTDSSDDEIKSEKKEIQDSLLIAMDEYMACHSRPHIKLSKKLCQKARLRGKELAKERNLEQNHNYNEYVYIGKKISMENIFKIWREEKGDFPVDDMDTSRFGISVRRMESHNVVIVLLYRSKK